MQNVDFCGNIVRECKWISKSFSWLKSNLATVNTSAKLDLIPGQPSMSDNIRCSLFHDDYIACTSPTCTSTQQHRSLRKQRKGLHPFICLKGRRVYLTNLPPTYLQENISGDQQNKCLLRYSLTVLLFYGLVNYLFFLSNDCTIAHTLYQLLGEAKRAGCSSPSRPHIIVFMVPRPWIKNPPSCLHNYY